MNLKLSSALSSLLICKSFIKLTKKFVRSFLSLKAIHLTEKSFRLSRNCTFSHDHNEWDQYGSFGQFT